MKTMKAIIYTLAALFGSIFLWHLFTPWGWLTTEQLIGVGMLAFGFFFSACFASLEDDIL